MHHRNHSHVVFYLPIPRHFLPVTHIISLFHSSPRIVPVPIFKFCPKNRCNVIWHYYTRCLEHWTLVPGFPATSLPTSEPVVEWWADWSAPIPLSSRWTCGDGELHSTLHCVGRSCILCCQSHPTSRHHLHLVAGLRKTTKDSSQKIRSNISDHSWAHLQDE
jgi:hypothetical protein